MPQRRRPLASFVPLVLALTGCDVGLGGPLGGSLVTARDVSGTYTGVLQGVTVAGLADLDYPERQVAVNLDLLHRVSIRATSDWTVRIESPVIPPLRAIVAGSGPVALNVEFLEFEGRFDALKVKQIVFVQHEGEWIVVLQLIRVGVAPGQAEDVYVYQYVSYPSRVAERLSEDEVIAFVNAILRLVAGARLAD